MVGDAGGLTQDGDNKMANFQGIKRFAIERFKKLLRTFQADAWTYLITPHPLVYMLYPKYKL